jgi:Tfp pilus assembly protein PilX
MTYNLKDQQKGIVSITVTMLIMVVLSLMTLSFARLMQREQRQAFDRQLSTQAFYSAESGINDALSVVRSGKQLDKKDCISKLSDKSNIDINPNLDEVNGYTCLTIESDLPDVRVQGVSPTSGKQITIQSSPPSIAVNTIDISWERDNSKTDFSGNGTLPTQAEYLAAPNRPDMIRVVVFKRLPAPSLLFNSKTFYFYPTSSAAAAVNFDDATSGGRIYPAKCATISGSTEYACKAQVSGNFATTERSATPDRKGDTIVAVSGVYKTGTDVSVAGKDGGSNTVLLSKSQYRIDSNGKAADVRRRIQVRVSQGGIEGYSPYLAAGLVTDEPICKRFMLAPGELVPSDARDSELGGPGCTP